MNMDGMNVTEPSAPLFALGEADAAVCADGFCTVPAPSREPEESGE
jgi:hypothetical protein